MQLLRLILISCLLLLGGCDTKDSNKAALQSQVAREADMLARSDWGADYDFEALVRGVGQCLQYEMPCRKLAERIGILANGFASCDGSSRLCVELKAKLASTEHMALFRNGLAEVEMPAHPFYFSLGNELLNTYQGRYGYRAEMFELWLQEWKFVLMFLGGVTCICLFSYVVIYRQNQRFDVRLKVHTESFDRRFDAAVQLWLYEQGELSGSKYSEEPPDYDLQYVSLEQICELAEYAYRRTQSVDFILAMRKKQEQARDRRKAAEAIASTNTTENPDAEESELHSQGEEETIEKIAEDLAEGLDGSPPENVFTQRKMLGNPLNS